MAGEWSLDACVAAADLRLRVDSTEVTVRLCSLIYTSYTTTLPAFSVVESKPIGFSTAATAARADTTVSTVGGYLLSAESGVARSDDGGPRRDPCVACKYCGRRGWEERSEIRRRRSSVAGMRPDAGLLWRRRVRGQGSLQIGRFCCRWISAARHGV